MNARAAAVTILDRVMGGRSLNDTLGDGLRGVPASEQALARELVYGVLRWYSRLAAVRDRLLDKPLKARDQDVALLLLVGLYQCSELRMPPHAAVSTAAEAARGLRKVWAVGLINAVLRRFLREREALLAAVDQRPETRCAHPAWLVDRFRSAWPQAWEALLAENNERAPMTLRVNRRRASRDQYLSRLAEQEIKAEAHPLAPDALVLATPIAVDRLPGFQDGLVSVQDAAAQQAADLLDVPAGGRVLDACAAPGGKTCHILERYSDVSEVVALDIAPERVARIDDSLRRLDLSATVVVGDAAAPEQWWDGRPFDRILLDAPCSGSGVIRRHPDIKWLRRESDLAGLAAVQRQLLASLWPLLEAGGKLLYATCSIFPEENERILADFVSEHADAHVQPLDRDWGVEQRSGRYILTGESGMDGFYYGCLSKS
jgi:16S rRNA (cytosine967-C5)-methyltransferase